MMELSKLADLFFAAGAITGLVLLMTFFRTWSNRKPLTKTSITLFTILFGFTALFLLLAGYLQSTKGR